MKKRSFAVGIFTVAVLLFGLTETVYGQSLNGTWVIEGGDQYDPKITLNNGIIDSDFIRGTYTAKNNDITITVTHWSRNFLFAVLLDFDDEDMPDMPPTEWYTREQLGVFLRNLGGGSAQEINEILDPLYPTNKTTAVTGGKKFTLPGLDSVFVKK